MGKIVKKNITGKLKGKILILILGIILLTGQLVFQSCHQSKERKAYEEMKKQMEMQEQEKTRTWEAWGNESDRKN